MSITWANFTLLLFALAWALTGIYRRYATAKGYVDSPNVRSSHYVVTPRGGGIIFSTLWMLMILVGAYNYWFPGKLVAIFLPCYVVALIGFKDDMKSTSIWVRLGTQLFACGLSLAFIELSPQPLILGLNLPYWILIGIVVFAVLWMTNLMNFMDGTDGICATTAVFILGTMGVILYQIGGYSLSIICIGACALILGFLAWNWPTAHIFMGDSGSGFLGFMIAIMAVVSHKWYKVPYEIWLILSSMFWFDATVTLIRRILHGDKWTEAHCLHAYQRLTHIGWSHLRILLWAIAINSALAWFAWTTYKQPEYRLPMLGLSVCLLTVVYLIIEMKKPMYKTWHSNKKTQFYP